MRYIRVYKNPEIRSYKQRIKKLKILKETGKARRYIRDNEIDIIIWEYSRRIDYINGCWD